MDTRTEWLIDGMTETQNSHFSGSYRSQKIDRMLCNKNVYMYYWIYICTIELFCKNVRNISHKPQYFFSFIVYSAKATFYLLVGTW